MLRFAHGVLKSTTKIKNSKRYVTQIMTPIFEHQPDYKIIYAIFQQETAIACTTEYFQHLL
jgi:hypothetical protein